MKGKGNPSLFGRHMKTSFILASMIVCASARADIPKYEPMRDSVEAHAATDAVPREARIFIGGDSMNLVGPDYAAIVQYREHITLRQIVDGTPYNDTPVTVLVMRAGGFMRFISRGPAEKPDFDVKAEDLIWLLRPHTDFLKRILIFGLQQPRPAPLRK